MKYVILTLVLLFNLTISFGQDLPENCEYARNKYLETNQDVKTAKMDPWVHYNKFGKKEGRIWCSCKSELIESNNEQTTVPSSNPIILGLSKDETTGCEFYTYNSDNRYGVWSGECNNDGLIDGTGTMTLYEGDSLIAISTCTYIGGYRNGKSIDSFMSGQVFTGDYVNGLKEGKGKEVFANGDYYEGDYKNGIAEGKGKMVESNGDTYVGDWKDGKREGKGKIDWKSGGYYEGDWKNGTYKGKGKIVFSNGNTYVGDFKNGTFEGKGKEVFGYDGSYYEGDWKDGGREGKGKYVDTNGDSYEGDWKNGVREGKGKMVFSNGDTYVGDWKNGVREGKGKMVYPNGNSYEGDWKDGKMVENSQVVNSKVKANSVANSNSSTKNNQNISTISNAQTNYKLSKIEIQNPRDNSWVEMVLLAPLEIYIDENKNITFNDYHMTFMEILAGKEYIGLYDALIFINSGLNPDENNNYDGYDGKLKLVGNKNLPQSKDAYARFMYYPNSKKLGIIEISNYFCRCHVRLWL